MASGDGLGLTQRELEREFHWMLNKPLPADRDALVKALGELVIRLIVKNNEALAEDLARQDDPDADGGF